MSGAKKYDFSAFEEVVNNSNQQPLASKYDYSAFDEALKKKDGGTELKDGSNGTSPTELQSLSKETPKNPEPSIIKSPKEMGIDVSKNFYTRNNADATYLSKNVTGEKLEQFEKHKKDLSLAIDNTTDRALKNKGLTVSKNSPTYIKQRKKVEDAVKNGDATYSIDPLTKTPALSQTTGFFESAWNALKSSVNDEDEADSFMDMNTEERIKYAEDRLKKIQPTEEGYIGEKPGGVTGKAGELLGGLVPFATKMTAGTLAGGALIAAAPETAGASLAGLPAVVAFATTAPSMINQGGRDEVIRRYDIYKKENPNVSDIDAMKEAEKGLVNGEIAGGLTNLLFTSVGAKPIAEEARLTLGKYLNNALKSATHMGATVTSVKAGQEIAAGFEDKKLKETLKEGINNAVDNFTSNFTVGGALHIITSLPTLPGAVKSSVKYALSKENPLELAKILNNNEQLGNIPQGTTEKVMSDISDYNKSLNKTSTDLSPETQASVAGLIQKRDNLMSEMASKDATQIDSYLQQVDGLNEQIKKITESNDPFAHEVNDLGQKINGEISEEPLQKGVEGEQVGVGKITTEEADMDAKEVNAEQQKDEGAGEVKIEPPQQKELVTPIVLKSGENITPTNILGNETVFHASNTERKGRLKEGSAEGFGEGIYFGTDKEGVQGDMGNNLTEAKLNLSNPVYTSSKEWSEVEQRAVDNYNKDYTKKNINNFNEDQFNEQGYVDKYNSIDDIHNSKYISDAAKELGYDAIIDKNKSQYGHEILVLDESKIIYPEDIAELPKQPEVEKLRAEEQAELDTKIPNAEQYRVDGKVDRSKLTSEEDKAAFDEVYDKYDKLITPLLKEAEVPKQKEIQITGVDEKEIVRLAKPITDRMVEIEREFENQGYTIDTTFDNEIQILDKDGEQVEFDDLPNELKDITLEYQSATAKLGDISDVAREKALAESRKVVETEAEVIEPEKVALPEQSQEQVNQQELKETENLLNDGDKIRKEGKYVKDGVEYIRNEKGLGIKSEEGGSVRFTSEPGGGGVSVPFTYKLIESETLQPSHQDGLRNPNHFIWEAQPKNRNDEGSIQAEEGFANKPRFTEMGENTNAYSGAPIVNERGEVIQGNNRSAGLKKGYQRGIETYKKSLAENAEKFGFTKEQVEGMKNPVLVREVAVLDSGAIELGNYDVKDLESGGKRRLDPVAITRRMPFELKGRISDLLFKGEGTLNQAIRDNTKRLMELINPYLNQAQRNTIFKDGELTQDGAKDLETVAQHFLFDGGDTALPELHDNLSHTQKEGLRKSLPHIFSTGIEKSIVPEVQEAILALNDFAASKAGSFDSWLAQGDMFNNGMTPKDKYSPTAIKIAEILNDAKNQKEITTQFGKYAELVNDKPATMFDEATKGISKKEGIKQIFKTEYDESKRPAISEGGGKEISTQEEPLPQPSTEPSAAKSAKPTTKAAAEAAKPKPTEPKPTEVKPELPEQSALEKAKEARRAAKKKLNDIRNKLGISPDPKKEAEALFEYHKALVTEAKEYIKAGIKTVEEWAKEVGEKVSTTLQTAWDEATGKISPIKKAEELISELPKPTVSKKGTIEGGEDALKGITMEDNAKRREEIGMPERQPNPESVEQWRAEAENKIANGYNINDLIDKMEKGEQTTKVENEISRIFAATLDAEVKNNPTNENINAYERLIKAREKSSSEIGRALRSLQGVSNPFENISDFYVAKKEANKVDNLTESQKEQVQKDFENIQKTKDEYEKKWKEAETKFAEMQAQNELLRQQKESGKKYIKAGKKDFVAERKDLKDKLKNEIQKYKNNTKKLGISSDGGAENFAITVEMAKIIGKIAKSHVEEIGAKLADVTQRTFDDVKDLFDGIVVKDIHDIIAGKYSERRETKSELLSNLRQIQAEAKLLNELDRVLAGEPKEEKQKIEKNQKLADLRRQINDVKKSGGLEEYSEEATIEKATSAAKENIKELEDKLAKNDLDVQKAQKVNSPELESLRKKQKQLRDELESKRKEEEIGKYSEEARAKKAIESNKRKEEKIKERLANNDFDPEEKRESIYDSKEFKSKNPKLYKELLDSLVKRQEAELEFHKKLVENEMANMGNVDKFKQVLTKARGTLKAIFAGIDDSAVGVQNWFLAIANPSIGLKAIKEHVLDFWSQKRFDRNIEELHNSSDWNMIKESGLQVSEPKSLAESGKEEMFPDRFKAIIKLKGKEYGWINIGGKKYEVFDVLKPFERAFTSLGNSLRVIKFRIEAEKMHEKGITFENNPEEFKKLATRINAMTSASKPNEAFKSDVVNLVVWSPRLMASKLNILGISDLLSYTPLVKKGYYRSLGEKGKVLSKQQLYAVADLAKFATSIVAGSYLFAAARGGQLNTNPFDDSFMDIELPNGKSFNFTGGFSKYISTLFQIARGGKVNKMTKQFEEYKGFKDRGSEIIHFLRGKMPPISGSIVNLTVGRDYTGKETSLSTEAERYKMPMSIGQIYDQVQKDGYSSLYKEGIPTFLGINVKDKRDYIETGIFTKEDTDKPELKVLTDKGLSIPRLLSKETYKIKRDEKHPEGVMTDDEYKELTIKVHDNMINGWEDEDGNIVNGIKELLNTNYNVQTYTEADEEEPSEESILGKDLSSEQLKSKLSDLKQNAVKKAIEDMGLTKKSKIITKEEK